MTSFQLKKQVFGLVLLGFCTCAAPSFTSAQEAGDEGIKIMSATSKQQDNFGKSVAIDGDYNIIGAWTADDNGPESGVAYIHKREADHWKPLKKLVASDGGAFHNFGSHVAIQGDYALVSAEGHGEFAGAVYVFHRHEGGADHWGQTQILTAPDRQSGDYFGSSIAIDNGQIAVGATGSDDHGRRSGAVYTFRLEGNQWMAHKKMTDKEGTANDHFGSSVAIDETTLIVGATRDNKAGSIIIFEKTDGDWQQRLKVFASDGKAKDAFGNSLSLFDNRLAVGADGVDGFTGAVYIFERHLGGSDNWGELKKIQPEDGDVDDHFGKNISLYGDYLLIGSEGHHFGMGATYLFRKDKAGNDNWGLANKMHAIDGNPNDAFGSSVALSGEDILVGAHQSERMGGAYLFKTMDKGMFARKD